MIKRTHTLIITLNVNAPSKGYRLAKWIQNKTRTYAIYKRPTSDLETRKRLKVRGWKTKYSMQIEVKKKKSQSGNTCIRQNRLSNKDCYKRQRRTLHNDQGINPRRRRNNCKYICTQ